MTTPFKDDFTESSNTNLEDHTPTGTGAGTAWTLGSGAAGSAIVRQSDDSLRSANTTNSYYTCDDQGSADHYTIHRHTGWNANHQTSLVANRLADASNCVGMRLFGTGSTGRRLTKIVANVYTDLITSQGVDSEWIKVEALTTTVKLFEGGAGGSPSWTQVGSDQTYSENTTETSQGVFISDSSSTTWIDDLEAGALADGVITASPIVGNNTINGLAPTIDTEGAVATELSPSVGNNVINGLAPTVGKIKNVQPVVGNNIINGLAPTIEAGAFYIAQPIAGNNIINGLQPTVGKEKTLQPSGGELHVDGQTPTLGLIKELAPTVGAIIVNGLAPSVAVTFPEKTVAPIVGNNIVNGLAPSVQIGAVGLLPSVGNVYIEGNVPKVTRGIWAMAGRNSGYWSDVPSTVTSWSAVPASSTSWTEI